MKISPPLALIIVILLLIVAGAIYWSYVPKAHAPAQTATATSTPAASQNAVTYSCDAAKTITATYASSTVALLLSDGRTFTLPQVESGSGIRYEQGSGTAQDIVFSSEGDNAFLTENGTTTYSNCIAGTNTPASTPSSGNVMLKSYTDQSKTFTLDYPNAFTVSGGGVGYTQNWMLNTSANGLLLAQITVPQSYAPKTNFVGATLTIGTSSDPGAVAQCLTMPNSDGPATKSVVTINGVQYTKYVYSGVGAGQIYNTSSYRTIQNSQCYAIEYTIHTSQLANFPPSAGITAFDPTALQSQLDGIVQSFKFL